MAGVQPHALIATEQLRYISLAGELASLIASGAVAPSDRLPGERELCRRFNTSRDTVRRALAELRDQGMIEADPQRGWFVTSAVMDEPNTLMSFSEMARSRGLVPTAVVLSQTVRAADLDESDALAIAPGVTLFELVRVRSLDGLPISLEKSRIPLQIAPELAHIDFSSTGLYDTLRAAGAIPTRADYALQAIPADVPSAHALDLEEGDPLLRATATTYDDSNRAIELSEAAFRGDRYRFHTTLYRTGA
jgi:GntR family transcriptional regulator